jgi:DNA-binding transcriptional LysR family regulator
MDRLTAAKVFVDVAYSGSFTATADRLELSRPMVTRYIEEIENWLQVRLLHRTTRRVSLTSAGESCLREIENWIEKAEEIAIASRNNSELMGTIRIATSMSFGFSQLAPIVAQFIAAHPKVYIDIDLQDGVADLVEQRIDLAIRIASNPEPSLIGKPIGVCRSVLVASPTYVQRHPLVRSPSDLQTHQCLGYKNFEQSMWHLYQRGQLQSVDVICRLTANEATTLLHAALAGAGIAMQPNYLADSYIKNGELLQVLPEWQPRDLIIYALYSSRKHLSPTVRAFIDFIELQLAHRELGVP